MKTYIGTLALLVTIGFTAEARADQELGLTLEPVTSEAQLHQAMVQNRARVAAMYRNIWEQAENAKQSQQQLKDGDQVMTQTRTRTRTQAKKQLKDGAQSGDQLQTQTRTRTQARKQLQDGTQTQTQTKSQLKSATKTQLHSALRAERDGDSLGSQLRYQTRERVRTGKANAQGNQGAGGKRLGGHGHNR